MSEQVAASLWSLVQHAVREELARQRTCLLGVVTASFPHESSSDSNNYDVNVHLKWEDLELQHVPVSVSYMGAASMPKTGDLVLVQFVDGDLNQAVVTGCFYHADEAPPFFKDNEILFEQRVAKDSTVNHLRFLEDGSIILRRKVTKLEDSSKALTGICIDKDGNIEVRVGDQDKVIITIDVDAKVTVKAPDIVLDCDTLKVTGDVTIDKTLTVTKDTTVKTQVVVGDAKKTTITGGAIQGG